MQQEVCQMQLLHQSAAVIRGHQGCDHQASCHLGIKMHRSALRKQQEGTSQPPNNGGMSKEAGKYWHKEIAGRQGPVPGRGSEHNNDLAGLGRAASARFLVHRAVWEKSICRKGLQPRGEPCACNGEPWSGGATGADAERVGAGRAASRARQAPLSGFSN